MIIDSPIISGSYSASGSLNQFGNVVISGSLTVTGSIIGTASYATTASYLSGYVSPFPYTGSAIISGSLTVTGSANIPSITGSLLGTATTASYALTAATAVSAPNYVDLTNSQNIYGYKAFQLSSTHLYGMIMQNGNYNTPGVGYTGIFANYQGISISFAKATSPSYYSSNLLFTTNNNYDYTFPATSGTVALTTSTVASASYAVTASNAITASYLTGYISPFPYTGSAVISGSLGVTGSFKVTNLSGSGVRYLVADESGSVTAQSASAALKSTQAFTSTAGQTTFSVTNGYSTGYVDVFINGSKLSAAEFTDTSGTNIVLATGSFSGDVVEVVKYTPAAGVTNNVLRQLTSFTATAGQTVFSASYTPGLLDIFYNGSRLSTSDYTANNGTFFTLATASAANDILDVLVYSYQVGAFSGIGGTGSAAQVAYFSTGNAITGSPNFTISGSTMTVTGSLTVSGSGTFTNIGPAVMSGSLNVSGAIVTNSTITAQTLVVQTITSSVSVITGSTNWGSLSSNTHTFTGSMYVTGALYVPSGSVGIGTITPTYPLQVSSSVYVYRTDSNSSFPAQLIASSSGATVITRAGTSADLFLGRSGSANYANVYYADSTVWSTSARWTVGMRSGNSNYQIYNEVFSGAAINILNSNNYVGIGTTSPDTILQVASGSGAGGTTYVYLKNTSAAANLNQGIQLSFGQDDGATSTTPNGYIKVLNTGGSTNSSAMAFGLYTYPNPAAEVMRITGSSVGIGTIDPGSTLEVRSADGQGIRFKNAGSSDKRWDFVGSGNDFRVNETGVGAVMSFKAGGNIGLGLTNPSSKVGIRAAGADGLILEQDSSSAINSTRLFFSGSGQTFALFNNDGDWRFTHSAQPGNTSGTSLARFTNTGKYFRMEGGTGGVQFQGNTAAANALNYYEEGTWTPSVATGGFTISSIAAARYTRIGRVVHCIADVNLAGSGNSSSLVIAGLPFTALSNGYSANSCYFSTMYTDNRNLCAISRDTSTTVAFEIIPTSNTARSAVGTDFGAGYMNLNIIYFV